MKRIVAFLSLGLTLVIACRHLLYSQSTSTIEGTVLEAETDRPLSGVNVSAVSPNRTRTATTDSQGQFTIDLVDGGRYVVAPAFAGFVYSPPGRLKAPREPGVSVQVSAGQHIQDIHLRMVRAGVVTGRVLNPNGQPLPAGRVLVELARYRYDENGKRELEIVPGVHIGPSQSSIVGLDDQGVYRIYGLQPGEYYVFTYGSSGTSFYPGGPERASAEPVHVEAGEEVHLKTITLQDVKPVQIRFHVVDTDGRPTEAHVSEDGFSLLNLSTDTLSMSLGQVAMPARFRDPNVSPSDRVLPLSPGKYSYMAGLSSPTEVFYSNILLNVENADMVQELRMTRGVRVTGTLLMEDDAGQRRAVSEPWCMLYSDSVHIQSQGASVKKPGPASGCLGAEYSPGLYYLKLVDVPSDAYVVSAKANGSDILESGFQLSGDSELHIVINGQGSVVDGVVSDSNDAKLSDAVVALVPDAPLRLAGPLYRSSITDLNGNYQLRGIAPGAYHLFAWTDMEGNAFRNADFMKNFDGRGTPVQIEKGGHLVVDLKIVDETKAGQN